MGPSVFVKNNVKCSGGAIGLSADNDLDYFRKKIEVTFIWNRNTLYFV